MVDDSHAGDAALTSVCPWCSASYAGAPENCPSCGATLTGDAATDPSLPGLTQIDATAIVRAKQPMSRPRNRFLSWISGDLPDDASTPAQAGALAPPELEVRREMLRLEIEADLANLQAEADAILADAALEGHPITLAPSEAEVDAAEVDAVESVAADAAPAEEVADTAADRPA